jgi:hypothetical protein
MSAYSHKQAFKSCLGRRRQSFAQPQCGWISRINREQLFQVAPGAHLITRGHQIIHQGIEPFPRSPGGL